MTDLLIVNIKFVFLKTQLCQQRLIKGFDVTQLNRKSRLDTSNYDLFNFGTASKRENTVSKQKIYGIINFGISYSCVCVADPVTDKQAPLAMSLGL